MDAIRNERSRKSSGRRWLLAIILMLGTVSCTGCSAVILLGYLIGGPSTIEAEFTKRTKKKMTGRDTTVVVYCYAPNDLKFDQDKVDYEVAKCVALRLSQNEIKVADPDYVYGWIDKNPDFERDVELGAQFNATYVIKIELRDYSLYAEHSADLFQGRCNGIVSVWEMDKKNDGKTAKKSGKLIFTKDLASRYPKESPVPFNQLPADNFKKLFLSALSSEIGEMFYSSAAGDTFTRTAMQ